MDCIAYEEEFTFDKCNHLCYFESGGKKVIRMKAGRVIDLEPESGESFLLIICNLHGM